MQWDVTVSVVTSQASQHMYEEHATCHGGCGTQRGYGTHTLEVSSPVQGVTWRQITTVWRWSKCPKRRMDRTGWEQRKMPAALPFTHIEMPRKSIRKFLRVALKNKLWKHFWYTSIMWSIMLIWVKSNTSFAVVIRNGPLLFSRAGTFLGKPHSTNTWSF